MKSNKSQKTHTDENAININTDMSGTSKYMMRALGMFLIAISGSLYVQTMPLLFVFTGGYLGVHPKATPSDMDTIIWILTCISILVPLLYAFIAWIKFVWRRFIQNPAPLFKKKKKHA